MPAGFREARSAVAVSAAAAVALAAAAALVARPITGSATAPGFAGYDAAAQSWGVDIRIVPVTQKEEVADIADEYVPHTTAQVNSTPHAVADGTFFDPGAAVRYGP